MQAPQDIKIKCIILLSSSGFSGVLAGICGNTIKLITDVGAAPSCPIGSCCTGEIANYGGCGYGGYGGYGYGGYGGYGYGGYGGYGYGGYGGGYGYSDGCNVCNILGSITEIPIERIASFTHNAV